MCGEKQTEYEENHNLQGSPPHVRGKDDEFHVPERSFGITPACAGKRSRVYEAAEPGLDHPRMCGEKQLPSGTHRIMLGSPPHVRGKDL